MQHRRREQASSSFRQFLGLLSLAALIGAASAGPSFHPADPQRGYVLALPCLACHAAPNIPMGEPAVHPPKLAGQRPEAIFEALLAYKDGARKHDVMQAFVKTLSLQDLRDLGIYLAAEGPVRPPRPVGEGSWAQDRVHRHCTACHGETGMGEMAGIPVIAGQHRDYLVAALMAYRDGSRRHDTMGTVARSLSSDEILKLADYFASQSHLRLEAPARPVPTDTPRFVAESLDMADIPAGAFTMGTDPAVSFQNGFPPHRVEIRAFRMSRQVVTFDQYDAFARATGRALPPDEGWGRGRRPVIHVSWRDAQAFIAWLNQGTGRKFRLPSEAEFEYAARGGTTTLYWWGDEPDPDKANTAANTGRDIYQHTSPAGAFPANPYGLFDVAGNVWQMTQDCRHGSYEDAPTDGSAWLQGPCDSRIVRGGGYGGIRRAMQVAARAATGETSDSSEMGFRLAESR